MIFSDFYCTECGQKGINLPRNKGCQRANGHLKKLFCLHCQKETNHVEIRPQSSYDYENFYEEFSLGRYVNGKIIPIKNLTPCKENCHYNINGKCWNSNYSNKDCTKERS